MNLNQRRPLSSTPKRDEDATLGLCMYVAGELDHDVQGRKVNKGEWNEATEWTVNGTVAMVVMKGERPDWSILLEAIQSA